MQPVAISEQVSYFKIVLGKQNWYLIGMFGDNFEGTLSFFNKQSNREEYA